MASTIDKISKNSNRQEVFHTGPPNGSRMSGRLTRDCTS
jgi:hypothetical protein